MRNEKTKLIKSHYKRIAIFLALKINIEYAFLQI